MKFFTLLILLLTVGYAYPSLNEDVPSNCQAVEVKLLSLTDMPFNHLITGLTQGHFGKLLAKRKFSMLPPQIGCAIIYVDVSVERDKYTKVVRDLLTD